MFGGEPGDHDWLGTPHMVTCSLSYNDLFIKIHDYLLDRKPISTEQITRSIKEFFQETYGASHTVLCTHAGGSEFLIDVMITTFHPKTIIQTRTLRLTGDSFSIYIAVESELGGVGASSAYGVMKNVVEDYLKLLMVRAKYRVMVFTSLPYANEDNHIDARVETLRDLYACSPGITDGVLLLHLAGNQPKSTQVQAQVNADAIRGFIITSDGKSAVEIKTSIL
ncbi:MAG: hypothetical protein Q8M09_12235 [Pseudomonadota bacterium]|nr:hypothetical protein [Pseudomonadota bacterium]